ncbi:hypothetical protein ABVT39_026247 [Epinephelus coioides]
MEEAPNSMVNILTHWTAFILKRHAESYLMYQQNAENLNSVDRKTMILLADGRGNMAKEMVNEEQTDLSCKEYS